MPQAIQKCPNRHWAKLGTVPALEFANFLAGWGLGILSGRPQLLRRCIVTSATAALASAAYGAILRQTYTEVIRLRRPKCSNLPFLRPNRRGQSANEIRA